MGTSPKYKSCPEQQQIIAGTQIIEIIFIQLAGSIIAVSKRWFSQVTPILFGAGRLKQLR